MEELFRQGREERMEDRRESGKPSRERAVSCFSQIHAHIPLPFLKKKIDLFLEHSLNPEIYFNYRALESTPEAEIAGMAATLAAHGRRVTIHGPFYDLSPGAIDPAFRALTVERLGTALRKAAPFLPDSIVFHPGYDPKILPLSKGNLFKKLKLMKKKGWKRQ